MHFATIDFDTIEIQPGITTELTGCIEVSGTPNNWTTDRIRLQADNRAFNEIEDARLETWLIEKVEAQYAEQIREKLQEAADDCDGYDTYDGVYDSRFSRHTA